MPTVSPPGGSAHGANATGSKQKLGLAGAIMKHRLWATAGTVVGVLALVTTYIQLDQDDKPADIEVANVSFGDPAPIEAKAGSTDTPEADWQAWTEPATPIDISLKNNGGAPARIIRIETKVLDAKTVSCSQQGGGSVVSAYYGVKIPYNPWTEELENDTVSTPVDYTVKAGSVDRMAITVGPEQAGNGRAIVMAVQLRLIQEQGDPIELEPLAVSQPDGVDAEIRADYASSEPQCLSEQAAVLSHIFELSKMQAPEVVRLRDGFQPVT